MLVLPASRADGRWRGRAALNEAALRRRSRGERASPCADTVAPADSRWLAWLSAMSHRP